MKDRWLLLITLTLIVFQTSFLQLFRLYGVLPNLVMLWLIIVVVIFGRYIGIKTALYAGFFTDVLIGKGIGVYLAFYLLIALIISSIEAKIFKDNYITPFVLIFTTTVFFHTYMLLIDYFVTGELHLAIWLFRHVIPEALYNLVVGMLCYTLSIKWYSGYKMR